MTTTRCRMLTRDQWFRMARGMAICIDDPPLDVDRIVLQCPVDVRPWVQRVIDAIAEAVEHSENGYDALADHAIDEAIEALNGARP